MKNINKIIIFLMTIVIIIYTMLIILCFTYNLGIIFMGSFFVVLIPLTILTYLGIRDEEIK